MKRSESEKLSLNVPRSFSVPWVFLVTIPLLIILAIVAFLFIRDQAFPVFKDQSVLVPPPPEVNLDLIRALLPQDSIQSIDDPQFVPATEGTAFMEPDERIIGLVINGDARAYPIPILSNHEIVNDVVGGEPVVITWCPLCFSALVFSRNVESQEQPLTFGVSGSLLYDTLVMYDRQTESVWSQLYGAALEGPLEDKRLAFFPSLLTEWSDWQELHPESQVLSKPLTCAQFQCGTYSTNPWGSYDVDPYEGYYNTSDEGVFERQIPRGELSGAVRPKERVLGIRVAGQARAYPYRILQDQFLVNDIVNGVPVLLWFDPDSQTGTAYIREVNGKTITFQADPQDPRILIDEEDGGRWQVTTGTAMSGPRRGDRLPPLVVTPAFAFGWYDYFPASETYEPG